MSFNMRTVERGPTGFFLSGGGGGRRAGGGILILKSRHSGSNILRQRKGQKNVVCGRRGLGRGEREGVCVWGGVGGWGWGC